MDINVQEAIINVAPYDTNTTEIESVDLALNGTNLTVSVNGKSKTADMSSLVPASMADRFLADATYDKKKKELVLVTRKEGEDDKEFRVPISHIFQVEVEELFTKEDGAEFNFGFYHNDINHGNNISATGVGKIKGTDWYVFKFNQAEVDDFKTKLDVEKAKRPFALTDVNTSNFEIKEFFTDNKLYLYLPAPVINIDNQDVIKANTLPTMLGYKINGQVVKEFYLIKDDETGVASYPVQSQTSEYTRYDGFVYPVELEDGDEVDVEIFVRQGNTHNGETVKSFTYYGGQDYIDAPEFMLKTWRNDLSGIYNSNVKTLYNYKRIPAQGEDSEPTIEITPSGNTITFKRISDFKQDSLPKSFKLVVDAMLGGSHTVAIYNAREENGKITGYQLADRSVKAVIPDDTSVAQMKVFATMQNDDISEVYSSELRGEWGTI